MSARKDPRTGKWFFRKWAKLPTGERRRVYGGPYDSKKLADDAERKKLHELEHPEKQPPPTFDVWFNGRFWNERVLGASRRANSPSEQESKRSIYKNHLKEFFGALPLDRIDHALINVFRAQLRAKKRQEKTINNILAVLSTPLTYAVKAGVIDRAPPVGVAKVERPEAEFIELEDVAAILDSAAQDREPEYVVAILLALEAGLRIGEIKALRWKEDIDMRARTITVNQQVRPVKGEDGKIREVFGPPKGRTRRTIPMTPALYDALRHRVPRSGFVVPGERGHKHTSETRSAMERIAKRAGLDIAGEWHILRHTFATHAAMLAANPWSLNQWMGHKRMEETMLYVSLANAHRREIPAVILSAGAAESDPDKRILAMLSARRKLEFRAASGQRKSGRR